MFTLLIAKSAILGLEIVAGNDLYGGSYQLLTKVFPERGIVVTLVLPSLSFILINSNWYLTL